MLRRFLALVLTAVITGAPVSTVVCQAACAEADARHLATHVTTAEHHSCHGDAALPGTVLTAPAHPCGHADQLPPARDQIRQALESPPAIVPGAAVAVTLVDLARPAARRVQSSPPLYLSLTTPLRL